LLTYQRKISKDNMSEIKKLFENNLKWASDIKDADSEFFTKLAKQQSPEYLWIGCSDSRVPANQIVGLLPGEIFVHRNVGNVVVHTDLNCLSVIQFAIEILQVKHIIVCGHYDCGGIKAALENQPHGLIDNWLRHIKDVHRFYKKKLDELNDEQAKLDLLCELNVMEQVANVCHTTILQHAWKAGKNVTVHGWVYGINNGIIKDLGISVSGIDGIQSVYKLK
jgi:carbonic anhydrase